jgi:competence protein ComEA
VVQLLRPEPRRSWRDRAADAWSVVTVARVAAGVGATALVAVAAWWLLHAPGPPVEQTLPTAASRANLASSAPLTTVAAGAPATVVVQAAGAVRRPGVYRLAAKARVVDLVVAAGGAVPGADTQAVALASPLADGSRIYVPKVGEASAPVGGPPTAAGPTTTTGPLDVNSASASELEALPGVGPATAAAVIEYRTRHGPFGRVDDLLDVRGIGPAKLDGFRDQVRV